MIAVILVLKKVTPNKTTRKYSSYNITLEAPPMFVCMKNTALGGVSRQIQHLALPHAVLAS